MPLDKAMPRRSLVAGLLLTQLCCLPALAESPVYDEKPVFVTVMRNPELKPYGVMLAGLDAFDEHRA